MIAERDVRVGGDGSLAMFMQAERPARDLPCDGDDLREAIRRHEFYRRIDAYFRRGAELRGWPKATIPGNAYTVHTGTGAIALSAATAKTIWYVNAGAANQPSFVELCVSFDGVTASAVPALVELVYGTKATNSTPGTNSTTFTPLQTRGWPTQASSCAAANACSAEPTVLVMNKQWLLTPNGGLLLILTVASVYLMSASADVGTILFTFFSLAQAGILVAPPTTTFVWSRRETSVALR